MAGPPTAVPFGNPPFSNPVTLDELWRNILYDQGMPAATTPSDIHAILKEFDLLLFNSMLNSNPNVALGPTNCIAATFPRNLIDTNGAINPTSGTMYISAVYLPQNLPVSNINFTVGTTGDAGPSGVWGELLNSSRTVVATTNSSTGALTALSGINLPIANIAAGAGSQYITATAGLYYIGITIYTPNAPSFAGITGSSARDSSTATMGPFLSGSSTTSLTGPQAVGATGLTGTTVANVPYFWLS